MSPMGLYVWIKYDLYIILENVCFYEFLLAQKHNIPYTYVSIYSNTYENISCIFSSVVSECYNMFIHSRQNT